MGKIIPFPKSRQQLPPATEDRAFGDDYDPFVPLPDAPSPEFRCYLGVMIATVADQEYLAGPSLTAITRYPADRVHSTLLRRIDACATARTAAALRPIQDHDAVGEWTRTRARGDKLRRALIAWLSRPF
jgi:hypothetical protein